MNIYLYYLGNRFTAVHGRSLSFSHGENVIHSAKSICESAQVVTSYFSTGYVVHI